LGAPLNGDCAVLPLIIRERVTALLYADAGRQPGTLLDISALEILAHTAALRIELLALRKSGATTMQAASPGVAPVVSPELATSAPQPTATATAAASPPAAETLGGRDAELHSKAQRFARLLVDEIKLYNQVKVTEGKRHRDLYDRLKDDIDKSRASYDQRYGQSAAATGDYFNRELVRSLADNDPALLGSNFPR
jgi:hypothetical protein